ncbi:MAG: HAMP domain-containing histidine kinase [Scytolyngbya sp. HA4215-MV1]|nr:HAMP domain-containing histidine kinase [Scytolyngbya sp. HA4215-MV1]
MPKWLLPTLSEILILVNGSEPEQFQAYQTEEGDGSVYRHSTNRTALERLKAEREWRGAIAALSALLEQSLELEQTFELEPPLVPFSEIESLIPLASPQVQGMIVSGPSPVFNLPQLAEHLATWTFTPDWFQSAGEMFQLPPADREVDPEVIPVSSHHSAPLLTLLPHDPLVHERFCLVLTASFSLVMVLGEDELGQPQFRFSFDPDGVQSAWQCLRQRVVLTTPYKLTALDDLYDRFPPIPPSYKLVTRFSHLLLAHLPEPIEKEDLKRVREGVNGSISHDSSSNGSSQFKFQSAVHSRSSSGFRGSLDVELLQAIAHEVRTPLATIRTLTRLLLKRKDLVAEVRKRLEMIDRECSEQIDRFGFISRAVELETTATKSTVMPLTATPLADVFQQSIPRWQQQAQQRQLTLEVVLPQKMPTVVSDPTMLDQALTSLIERFTRNLPAGSHIEVQATQAGSQLKLQLQSQPNQDSNYSTKAKSHQPILKSLGQMLMFQPETGSLSLNLAVTKNLFQALGGKLIVRQRPQQGEVMTVFLPLEVSSTRIYEV